MTMRKSGSFPNIPFQEDLDDQAQYKVQHYKKTEVSHRRFFSLTSASDWTCDLTCTISETLKNAHAATRELAENCVFNVNTATAKVGCVISKGYELVSYWELPEWLRDNEYIVHFHRAPTPSVKKCFKSMFRVHSETGNIWSHFLGLIFFITAIISFYFQVPHPELSESSLFWFICFFWLPVTWTPFELYFYKPNMSWRVPLLDTTNKSNRWLIVDHSFCRFIGLSAEEHIVVGIFFVGAIVCLTCSWLFHTLICHSPTALYFLSKLDYAGIAFLIVTSSIPPLYYGFYCHSKIFFFYLGCITLCGTLSIIATMSDGMALPKYRHIRAAIFLALGLFGIIPIVHVVVIEGFWNAYRMLAIHWLVTMGSLYVIGALLYANRIPEKYFPDFFNVWLQSHQIFHVLVVAALFAHLRAVYLMVHYRMAIDRRC